MRWRTEKEVFSGKGQFICGNKTCEEKDKLCSYEVNFSYMEKEEQKNALVKLRLCPSCAEKLMYKRNKEKEKQESKEKLHSKRHATADKEEGGKDSTVTKKQRIEKTSSEETEETKQPNNSQAVVDDDEEPTVVSASNPWKKKIELEKTKEEEFEEYFQGLFP
jgi:protein FRA10AC1